MIRLDSPLGLPEGNDVHASLTLGWPAVTYKKTIRRHLAEARFMRALDRSRKRQRAQTPGTKNIKKYNILRSKGRFPSYCGA